MNLNVGDSQDVIRIAGIMSAGAALGVAAMNLRLAWKIIKPWQVTRRSLTEGDGLFWAHIAFVVIPMHGLLIWATLELLTRIGRVPPPVAWRGPSLIVCSLLILAGNVTVYRIKNFRLQVKERADDRR